MNDCELYQLMISRSIDEELTAAEQNSLAEHLESCEECAMLYAAFSGISKCIEDDLEEAPEALSINVMAELRRAEIIKKNKRKRLVRGLMAAAACFALIIVSAVSLPQLMRGMSGGNKAESAAAAPAEAPAEGAAMDRSYAAFMIPQTTESESTAEAPAAPAPVAEEAAAEESVECEEPAEDSVSVLNLSDDAGMQTALELTDDQWAELEKLLVGSAAMLPDAMAADACYALSCSDTDCRVELLIYGQDAYFSYAPSSEEYCLSEHKAAVFETFLNG